MSGLSYDAPLQFGDVCLWVEIFYTTCGKTALVTRVEVISISGENFEIEREEIAPNLLRAFDNIAHDIVINDEEIIGSLCGHGV